MDTHPDASHQQPATFAGRGVAMPFTSPGLAGTRVRAGASGLELVFANPSGARGTYVVPWAGVPDICQPTLHDLRLLAALDASGGRDVIGPARVQAAARRVALDGAAGRPVRAAAEAAMATDQARIATTAHHLLSALSPALSSALASAGPAAPDAREAGLLARAVAELGIGPGAEDAPVPRGIAALLRLRDGLLAWAAVHPEDAAPAQLVAALAAHAAAGAATVLGVARHASPVALLLAWLLDGWRLPGLVWTAAAPGNSLALTEAAQLAPLPPREAEAWTGLLADPSAPGLLRRMLAARAGDARAADLRAAPAPDLVARNERLRAVAA